MLVSVEKIILPLIVMTVSCLCHKKLRSKLKNLHQQESERHGHTVNTLSHSSALSSSSWFLSQKDPRPLRTDLDFKNYQYNYNLFLAEEFARAARMHSERIVRSQTSKKMLALDFDTWT